jgi:hypothetical protein
MRRAHLALTLHASEAKHLAAVSWLARAFGERSKRVGFRSVRQCFSGSMLAIAVVLIGIWWVLMKIAATPTALRRAPDRPKSRSPPSGRRARPAAATHGSHRTHRVAGLRHDRQGRMSTTSVL